METVSKWKLKIANLAEANEDLLRKLYSFNTYLVRQMKMYPRLTFLLITFTIVFFIFERPWILVILPFSFFTGFHSSEFLHTNLPRIISYIQEQRRLRASGGKKEDLDLISDPLLNTTDQVIIPKKTESAIKGSSGPSKFSSLGLKINPKLDKSIARFCSLVFETYISPTWAPYLTRTQLKLAFVKLLTTFGESVLGTFAVSVGPEDDSFIYGVQFCKEKVIPLAFRHIREAEVRRGKPLRPQELKRALWKIRRLCRTLLEAQLSQDDQTCLLWMELCVSVLADGVIWNLVLLGRKELPVLIEELVDEKLNVIYNDNETTSSSTSQTKKSDNVDRAESTNDLNTNVIPEVEIRVQEPESISNTGENLTTNVEKEANIPFLLDNFLDPSHDLEQAAEIVSRWRPTLNDILNERELLYALIQYLRSHKALEYLQAVLDDSPDGSEYCRKILELEYLPGFCRSKLFLESLGLNRVDEVGLEAGMESNTLKKPMGHTRSASYGNESPMAGIKLWKEQRVVDGIAIYDKLPRPIPFQEVGNVDSADSIFKRRHVLEVFITKFYKSVNIFGKSVDPLSEPMTARRLGIDFKEYDDFYHPDVLKRVQVQPCDVLAETVDLVNSMISKAKWVKWISSGWMKLLHPYIKPKFNTYLDNKLGELLSVDNFIRFVDLITDAFMKSSLSPYPPSSNDDHIPKAYTESVGLDPSATSSSSTHNSNSFDRLLVGILECLFDLKEIIHTLDKNGDEFILFCVDLLDILVAELIKTNPDGNTKSRNLMHSTRSSDYDKFK